MMIILHLQGGGGFERIKERKKKKKKEIATNWYEIAIMKV